MPIRALIAAPALVALGGLAACAGSSSSAGGTPAPAVAAAPLPKLPAPVNIARAARPDERHLRNLRQITNGGNNAEAYWAASGKQLIFQWQEKVDAGCDQQYVINIDGTGLRRVSNGLGRTTCGYFYGNDQRVIYASSFKDSPSCPVPPDRSAGYVWPLNRLELWTSKADGSDLRQLTDNGTYNAEATLSPDGKRFIFTSTKDGDLDLYTMNVDGTDVRRVTRRIGYDGGAFFSPDGTKIVWRAWYPQTARDTADYLGLLAQRMVRPARMELWVANADGSDAKQITNLGGANFAPYFTRDGKKIIFSSNHKNPRSRNFDLFLVNADGSGLEQVTSDDDFDGFPMFSPDGKHIVWASNRHQANPGETNLFIAEWVP